MMMLIFEILDRPSQCIVISIEFRLRLTMLIESWEFEVVAVHSFELLLELVFVILSSGHVFIFILKFRSHIY